MQMDIERNFRQRVMKKIFELEEFDYHQHPVWTWCEDDEDNVEPVEYNPYLPEDHDALFIFAGLVFQDGMRTNGVISVRLSNRKVYLLSFFKKRKERITFRFQPRLNSASQVKESNCFSINQLGKSFQSPTQPHSSLQMEKSLKEFFKISLFRLTKWLLGDLNSLTLIMARG